MGIDRSGSVGAKALVFLRLLEGAFEAMPQTIIQGIVLYEETGCFSYFFKCWRETLLLFFFVQKNLVEEKNTWWWSNENNQLLKGLFQSGENTKIGGGGQQKNKTTMHVVGL